MPTFFTATEAGYANGMGFASNKKGFEGFQYVEFGRLVDDLSPGKPGHYLEYDNRRKISVNDDIKVGVTQGGVIFEFEGEKIVIMRNLVADAQWEPFLKGLLEIFGNYVVQLT